MTKRHRVRKGANGPRPRRRPRDLPVNPFPWWPPSEPIVSMNVTMPLGDLPQMMAALFGRPACSPTPHTAATRRTWTFTPTNSPLRWEDIVQSEVKIGDRGWQPLRGANR